MKKQPIVYVDPPKCCEICKSPIVDRFYDAKTTVGGQWANMCETCFLFGPGYGKLGMGFGQEFTKQQNGEFIKTAG